MIFLKKKSALLSIENMALPESKALFVSKSIQPKEIKLNTQVSPDIQLNNTHYYGPSAQKFGASDLSPFG